MELFLALISIGLAGFGITQFIKTLAVSLFGVRDFPSWLKGLLATVTTVAGSVWLLGLTPEAAAVGAGSAGVAFLTHKVYRVLSLAGDKSTVAIIQATRR